MKNNNEQNILLLENLLKKFPLIERSDQSSRRINLPQITKAKLVVVI